MKWREQIERGWLESQRGEAVDGPTAMDEVRAGVKAKARKRA